MSRYKVPSQASSGADTFSDNLVGSQITDGSSQLTNENFAIDRTIPERDTKNFRSQPFSNFISLDDLNEEEYVIDDGTTSSSTTNSDNNKLKFKKSRDNGNVSLYGSLKQRVNVAITNIIKKYPASVYVNADSPIRTTNNTAYSINYDILTNTTTFKVQYSLFENPLEIVFIKPEGEILPESENSYRDFFSSYTKYVVEVNSISYDILNYIEPDNSNDITFRVKGNCFNSATAYTQSYSIKLNNGLIEEFFQGLDDLEAILLNRDCNPIYTATFNVLDDNDVPFATTATWPVALDGWNLQISGIDYDVYVDKISSICDEIDGYKSNLIIRFLTSPQLFEFDTEEKKMESILQIYGQSFDQIKKYIDNIAYMRNISYDGINNLPDILLKNLSVTLGLESSELFDETSLEDSLYTRHDVSYDGISTGMNLVEAEYEFYRRILSNLANLYKAKGTRKAIEFFLKFLGAPEPLIVINEYVYNVNGVLPTSDVENDISDVLLGLRSANIATYDILTSGYTVTSTTGSTILTRDEYPVDETTGLPRKFSTTDGTIFYQMGAGWHEKTIEHRSSDILDTQNSILTGRTKTIKTMSKPFTYGEDYFDYYRNLPGLGYGYDITSEIDNQKASAFSSDAESRLILNRKNLNVFLSGSEGVDYDYYKRSGATTYDSFADFIDDILSSKITNSNVIKYEKQYYNLRSAYAAYAETDSFTPYNFISVNEFVNRLTPYWVELIEQFIPATTLWLGGNVIKNSSFGRPKYQHIKPCVPRTYTEALYPDFKNTILEDLETIIGGGTVDGIDNSENLRETLLLSGVTLNMSIKIKDTIFSGATDQFNPFLPYTGGTECSDLPPTISGYTPIICGFETQYDDNYLDDIKLLWNNTLYGVVNYINQNSIYTLEYETYIDSGNTEMVKFTVNTDGRCSATDDFDFYFEPEYVYAERDEQLKVYASITPEIYYTSGTTPFDVTFTAVDGVGNINFISNNPRFTSGTFDSGCTFTFTSMTVNEVSDFIVYDDSNAEQKIKIEGIDEVIIGEMIEMVGTTYAYTPHPKIQYRPGFSHGVKSDSKVYKVLVPISGITTVFDLSLALISGDIVEINAEDVAINDEILSMNLKPESSFTAKQFMDVPINGYKFAFDYDIVTVEKIATLTSNKTNIINNTYEFLPTSKVLVYTSITDYDNCIYPHFVYKYPENLIPKTASGEVRDVMINQLGVPIEVTSINLDSCTDNIYYQFNVEEVYDEPVVLFNGVTSSNVIASYMEETFEDLDMNIYVGRDCPMIGSMNVPDPPTGYTGTTGYTIYLDGWYTYGVDDVECEDPFTGKSFPTYLKRMAYAGEINDNNAVNLDIYGSNILDTGLPQAIKTLDIWWTGLTINEQTDFLTGNSFALVSTYSTNDIKTNYPEYYVDDYRCSGFTPFTYDTIAAPSDFDPDDISFNDVNIIDIFNNYNNTDKRYICAIPSTVDHAFLGQTVVDYGETFGEGFESCYYGELLPGNTEITTTHTHNTSISWTPGSSQRFVIVNGISLIHCLAPIGTKWVYVNENIVHISSNQNTYLKYIHCEDINTISSMITFCFDSCDLDSIVTIPPNITEISLYGFINNPHITSVILPSGLTSIGAAAFGNCYDLTTINLPSSVISIGNGAFYMCNNLTTIIVPSSCEIIEGFAFYGCSNLKTVTILSSAIVIEYYTFAECVGLETINIYCVIPPDLSVATDVFNNVDKAACELHVPVGTKSAYESAIRWQDFDNIIDDIII